jgi:hypothetical protein
MEQLEVELAGGWERIGAALLNNIFSTIAMIPMIVGFFVGFVNIRDNGNWNNIDDMQIMLNKFNPLWFLVGLAIFLAYSIWQCVLMSTTGQSLGKKLLNLKVIKSDGSEAGFVGTVLLREVVYMVASAIAVGIVSNLLFMMLTLEDIYKEIILNNLFSYIPTLICAVMLFTSRDRRTLQDKIANTVVIKLPPANAPKPATKISLEK